VRVVGNREAHEALTLAGLLRPVPLGSCPAARVMGAL
jgi:hypothetical protein